MATKKKLLEAAAGAAGGGAALNVEDVFSTYLYTGNDDKQGIPNGIALADGVGGGTSTEFDGVSDFLSRSSDLTGNADGKTFTLSCWVYRTGAVPLRAVYPFRYQGYFYLEVGTNGAINVGGANTSGSTILEATLPSKTVPLKVWTHILVSVDLSNTSNRHIYLNDVAASPTWVTYSNQDIDFTRTTSHINSNSVGSFGSARHAHIYLDYTYRDLSVTSNRRYFIDANGGSTSPSTLSALNPIVYLPMTSAYSIGENLGTGGDYTVNGSPKVVQSGTEYLSDYGKGGLVWLKSRGFTNTNTNLTGSHALIDTERGNTSRLLSNTTDAAQSDGSNYVNSFNSDGFTVGTTMSNGFDGGHRYASWTFRKAPKFFDVVTYTGNGVAGREIAHNLGTTVGFIVVKRTDTTGGWQVYHRSLGATKFLLLNDTFAATTNNTRWYDTEPTSTHFTVNNIADMNASGGTYVAYLFAHNDGDGDFGPTGDQDIIKCGSFTTNSSSTASVNLGWEPQWVIIKPSSGAGQWFIIDSMRGLIVDNNDKILKADATSAEANGQALDPTPTGFNVLGGGIYASTTYIYIAIRRGPMAVPESATEVFDVNTYANNGNSNIYNTGFNADMNINKNATSSDGFYVIDRLRGAPFLLTNSTVAETGGTDTFWNSGNNLLDLKSSWWLTTSGVVSWSWKRAPSFMDVVAYTGTGVARTVSHNLGVAPEMIWVKSRDVARHWRVYHSALGATKTINLNEANAAFTFSEPWNDTEPTDSVITVTGATANVSNEKYIAYLFASLDGVSKVGSYTGTGAAQNIDCGFSNGARFVLIKNASTGSSDWFVWDSVRGITSGDDPYLRLNLPNAEQTFSLSDIEPTPSSNGFQVNGSYFTINASGDTYIYYAIA